MKKLTTNSPAETFRWAEEYAKTLKEGDIVRLIGEMGAGKTVIAQGIAKGLGVEDQVTSPTYAYVNSYNDKLYHFDCYRICSAEQAINLGFLDYFRDDSICLIEWSENIEPLLDGTEKRVVIKRAENGAENAREILF